MKTKNKLHTNPSGQRFIVDKNLLAKDMPVYSSGPLKVLLPE